MRFIVVMLFMLGGCANTSRSGILARACGRTAQNADALRAFGFPPAPGRVVVFRLFASWCPYCKDDLAQIRKRFASGEWNADQVKVYLLAYANKHEDHASFAAFEKEPLGIPGVELRYVDQDFKELSQFKAAGRPLFAGWQGIPFGLLFGKDGRLVYRGHFSQSPPMQETTYGLVTELSREDCP